MSPWLRLRMPAPSKSRKPIPTIRQKRSSRTSWQPLSIAYQPHRRHQLRRKSKGGRHEANDKPIDHYPGRFCVRTAETSRPADTREVGYGKSRACEACSSAIEDRCCSIKECDCTCPSEGSRSGREGHAGSQGEGSNGGAKACGKESPQEHAQGGAKSGSESQGSTSSNRACGNGNGTGSGEGKESSFRRPFET